MRFKHVSRVLLPLFFLWAAYLAMHRTSADLRPAAREVIPARDFSSEATNTGQDSSQEQASTNRTLAGAHRTAGTNRTDSLAYWSDGELNPDLEGVAHPEVEVPARERPLITMPERVPDLKPR
jgi:hypothetical protein